MNSEPASALRATPPWWVFWASAAALIGVLTQLLSPLREVGSDSQSWREVLAAVVGLVLAWIVWAAISARTYRLAQDTLYVTHWWAPRREKTIDLMGLKSVFLGIFPVLGLPVVYLGSRGFFGLPGAELVFHDGLTLRIYRHYTGGPVMIRAAFSAFGRAVAAKKRSA